MELVYKNMGYFFIVSYNYAVNKAKIETCIFYLLIHLWRI